eukprot:117043_1
MVSMYYLYPCTWFLCERHWYWKHEYDRANIETTVKAVGIGYNGPDKIVLVLILFILHQFSGNNECINLLIKSRNFIFRDDEENGQMCGELTIFSKKKNIGRSHVRTPVTNNHHVFRLMHEK